MQSPSSSALRATSVIDAGARDVAAGVS
jgi:hypothetical protein